MLTSQPQSGRDGMVPGSRAKVMAPPEGLARQAEPDVGPATGEPGAGEPATGEPGAGEPGAGRPRADAAPAPLPARPGPAAARLGGELRRLRLERGISLRQLTRLIGLSAHSNLGEYERGSRIPPSDIVAACERLLAVPPGSLQGLRETAARERVLARRRRAHPASG